MTKTEGFETDAHISESGNYVNYVRGNELYVTDLTNGQERRLSFGATETVRNATASFVVQEELNRFRGYWMSPDESRIAYTQIDESPIAIENRIEFSSAGVETVAQRYPFAGTPNATVKLGMVRTYGRRTVWADLGLEKDIYLANVYWSEDSQHVYVGILSRDHKSLKMLDINPRTGKSRVMFEETSPTWINIRDDFTALKDGGFLWSSERSGFRHIYRYQAGGTNPVQITNGDWPISKINCVDEEAQKIYFSGWQDTALHHHIFSINFDGSRQKQLSSDDGRHYASFSQNCKSYIGRFSSAATPPQTRTFSNTGTPLIWLNENKLDESHPLRPLPRLTCRPSIWTARRPLTEQKWTMFSINQKTLAQGKNARASP